MRAKRLLLKHAQQVLHSCKEVVCRRDQAQDEMILVGEIVEMAGMYEGLVLLKKLDGDFFVGTA